MMNQHKWVRVFAPATTSNLAVGFDILGFPLADLGDEVVLTVSAEPGLRIREISGIAGIPLDPEANTATLALQSMLDYLGLKQGFELSIHKHIPLGSGLGGSAASACAAVFALNQFLSQPLPVEDLIPFALDGEEKAAGARHGDNVIPSLLGGLVLIQSMEPLAIVSLPRNSLFAAFVKADYQVNTRESRALLPEYISLKDHVKQSAYLAGFIAALYRDDKEALAFNCRDLLIEPRRAHLIPHFYAIQKTALEAGALACSISGSGPTVFALADSLAKAGSIARAMRAYYSQVEIDAETYVSPVAEAGARIMERGG